MASTEQIPCGWYAAQRSRTPLWRFSELVASSSTDLGRPEQGIETPSTPRAHGLRSRSIWFYRKPAEAPVVSDRTVGASDRILRVRQRDWSTLNGDLEPQAHQYG